MKNTVILALCLLFTGHSSISWAFEAEYGRITVDASGIDIHVYTYVPPDCRSPDILFVFHGLYRKAEKARDRATKLADAQCLVVFAPLFDKDRFPNWRYHRAGVVRANVIQPQQQWTVRQVQSLIQFSRQFVHSCCRSAGIGSVEDKQHPGAKVYLFGHSAGAQFLSRMAAYHPLQVERIILANPSVYVAPSLEVSAPYGLEGVFNRDTTVERLQDYLAQAITIYLGQLDTGEKNLAGSAQAKMQGRNRLERGRNIFRLAEQAAREHELPFNWTLVEVPEVGHSSKGMLQSPMMLQALGMPLAGR